MFGLESKVRNGQRFFGTLTYRLLFAFFQGTPSGPNPNMPFAKLESKPLFNVDGRLNPSITILGKPVWIFSHRGNFIFIVVIILGCNVQVPGEVIIMNSIVLPHKELRGSYKNQIIL